MFVGANATNNCAEYAGADLGLAAAGSTPGMRRLRVEGDSELVIRQMRGEWQVSDDVREQLLRALGEQPERATDAIIAEQAR